ncbi:MAG: glycosyltransferase family 39 protein [Patescibacteria group bacterium]
MISQRKKIWFLYFLMLFLELIVAAIILERFGFDFYQGGDSPGYMTIARNFIEHGIFSFDNATPYTPTNFRTPGYPLFLALIYLIFHSFLPAMFFGALIAAFAAPLIYLIAGEIFSEKTAFTAGILSAIEPLGLFLGVSILTEGVFTPVLLFSVYCFVKYLKTSNQRNLWGASALLGGATLIRPIMFYFWPVAILFIIYKERFDWRSVIRKAGVFVAIFFLILSPWMIRNKISINSWQIAGMQGYVIFVDHYGAVLRYLGEAGPLSDVQNKATAIVGSDRILTSQGSDELFRAALNGIKDHKLAYLNVYSKSMISFFIANGYKSLFIDILGIPAKAPFIPFELFLRFDFASILKTLNNMDFAGFLIYWGSKFFWVAIFMSFLSAFVYLLTNKNYRDVLPIVIFIAMVIFYFALITGPTAIGGGRTKAPINGLIFVFAVFGIFNFFGYLKRKLA